jgi:type IV pilus assembly protein PilV
VRTQVKRDTEAGFTMMEILVSLIVLVIGMLGIMALQAATVKGNRTSRQLERAKVIAAEVMEDLRGYDVTNPPTTQPAAVTTADGVTFTPAWVIEDLTGYDNLKRVVVTVTYAEDGDSSQTRGARLEMIRRTLEKL